MIWKVSNFSSGATTNCDKFNHAIKQLKFWAMCNKDVRLIDRSSDLTVVWYVRYASYMGHDWEPIDIHQSIFLWKPCFDWSKW